MTKPNTAPPTAIRPKTIPRIASTERGAWVAAPAGEELTFVGEAEVDEDDTVAEEALFPVVAVGIDCPRGPSTKLDIYTSAFWA